TRIESALSTRYARDLLETAIPVNTRLAQAQDEGTTVLRYDSGCAGSISYLELATEILPKMGY
ncbi:MAG: cobyrinic acid a,c-diamide synthase, partial [Myxococcota bacterium]|nr:cobyrinic acid a,c-diamide synthase [Myxococcota bacterium]